MFCKRKKASANNGAISVNNNPPQTPKIASCISADEIAKQGLAIEKPICSFNLCQKVTVCLVDSSKTSDALFAVGTTLPPLKPAIGRHSITEQTLTAPTSVTTIDEKKLKALEKSRTFNGTDSVPFQPPTHSSPIFDLQIKLARELRRLSEKHRSLGQSYTRYAESDKKSAGQLFYDAYNKPTFQGKNESNRSVLVLKELFIEEAKYYVQKRINELRRQPLSKDKENNKQLEKSLLLIIDGCDLQNRPESHIRWPLIEFIRDQLKCTCEFDAADPWHRLVVKVPSAKIVN